MVNLFLILINLILWKGNYNTINIKQLYDYKISIQISDEKLILKGRPNDEGNSAAWLYLPEKLKVLYSDTLIIKMKVNKNTVRLRYFYLSEDERVYLLGIEYIKDSKKWERIAIPLSSAKPFYSSNFPWCLVPRYSGWDILAMRSEDGGNTWTGPFVVNEVISGGQCKGWVTFDPFGGLHVTYYHTPDWPTNQYSLFSFWHRFSADSGKTFYPAKQVSDVSFRSWADFMGEYHLCLVDSNYIYAIWTDGRNGDDNDLYFSKALLSQLKTKEKIDLKIANLEIPTIVKSGDFYKILKNKNFNLYDLQGRKIKILKKGINFVEFENKIFKIISVLSD